MKYCEKCGCDSYVTDSRITEYGIRRRRQCENCGHRWSTIEVMAGWKPVIINNKWNNAQIKKYVKRRRKVPEKICLTCEHWIEDTCTCYESDKYEQKTDRTDECKCWILSDIAKKIYEFL